MGLSAAEQKELDALNAQASAKASPSGLTSAEQAELDALNAQAGPPPSAMHQIVEGAKNLGHGVGKALDTTAAAPRAVLAQILDAAVASGALKGTGKPVYDPDELLNAYNPTNLKTYPSSNELFKRAGIAEGAHLSDVVPNTVHLPLVGDVDTFEQPTGGADRWWVPNKGGMLDIGVRGTGGFLTDAGLDLANLVSYGAAGPGKQLIKHEGPGLLKNAWGALKSAPVAAAKYPSMAAEAMGRKLYESGILPVMEAGEKMGKPNVADTMYQAGMYGGASSLRKQAIAEMRGLKDSRDARLVAAGAGGGAVNMDARLADTSNKLLQMVDDGKLTLDDAGKIESELRDQFGMESSVDPMKATNYKTRADRALPSATWSGLTSLDAKNQIKRDFANGLRSDIEAATTAGKQDANALHDENAALGDLLTVRKPMLKQAQLERKSKGLDMTDIGLIFGGNYAPVPAATTLATKKIYQWLGPTRVKTTAGYVARKVAENRLTGGTLDAATRRVLDNVLKNKSTLDDEENP